MNLKNLTFTILLFLGLGFAALGLASNVQATPLMQGGGHGHGWYWDPGWGHNNWGGPWYWAPPPPPPPWGYYGGGYGGWGPC